MRGGKIPNPATGPKPPVSMRGWSTVEMSWNPDQLARPGARTLVRSREFWPLEFRAEATLPGLADEQPARHHGRQTSPADESRSQQSHRDRVAEAGRVQVVELAPTNDEPAHEPVTGRRQRQATTVGGDLHRAQPPHASPMITRRLALTAAIIAGTLSLTQPSRAGDSSARGNVIEFHTRPKNNNGVVVCALFDQGGWLTKPVKPAWGKIKDNRAVCVFNDVRPGTYGISAYHDENKNGKLDKNLVGMPTEDYGASRDARGTFSAPSFEDAKFDYKGGKLQMRARLM